MVPGLWIVILLCNFLCKKYTPELKSWYQIYSICVGTAFTLFALILAV